MAVSGDLRVFATMGTYPFKHHHLGNALSPSKVCWLRFNFHNPFQSSAPKSQACMRSHKKRCIFPSMIHTFLGIFQSSCRFYVNIIWASSTFFSALVWFIKILKCKLNNCLQDMPALNRTGIQLLPHLKINNKFLYFIAVLHQKLEIKREVFRLGLSGNRRTWFIKKG